VDSDHGDALRRAAPVRAAAVTAILAFFLLLAVTLVVLDGGGGGARSFLSSALGEQTSAAPSKRTPASGVEVRIHSGGYTVTRGGDSVSVTAEAVGGAEWRRHVHEVTRATGFGAETIVVDGGKAEEFLTVSERQGNRTWRWPLATRLAPRLTDGGTVSFLDRGTPRVTGLSIAPVRILDLSAAT
jgi:hypothetical protein